MTTAVKIPVPVVDPPRLYVASTDEAMYAQQVIRLDALVESITWTAAQLADNYTTGGKFALRRAITDANTINGEAQALADIATDLAMTLRRMLDAMPKDTRPSHVARRKGQA